MMNIASKIFWKSTGAREALGADAGDAARLTELYFGVDKIEALQNIASAIAQSELQKQEFYEWRKKAPHAVTPSPLDRNR